MYLRVGTPDGDALALRRSAANLHALGQAVLEQRARTGDLPATWSDLERAAGLLPERFLSPRLSPKPTFGDRPAWPAKRTAQWLDDGHGDYVYAPPPWHAELPNDWVLACEPTDVGLGEVLVLAGNGRVDLLPTAEAAARIKRQQPATRPALPNG